MRSVKTTYVRAHGKNFFKYQELSTLRKLRRMGSAHWAD